METGKTVRIRPPLVFKAEGGEVSVTWAGHRAGETRVLSIEDAGELSAALLDVLHAARAQRPVIVETTDRKAASAGDGS